MTILKAAILILFTILFGMDAEDHARKYEALKLDQISSLSV